MKIVRRQWHQRVRCLIVAVRNRFNNSAAGWLIEGVKANDRDPVGADQFRSQQHAGRFAGAKPRDCRRWPLRQTNGVADDRNGRQERGNPLDGAVLTIKRHDAVGAVVPSTRRSE